MSAVELEERGGGQVAGKRLVLVHVADAGEGAPLGKRLPQPEHAARRSGGRGRGGS